MATDKKKKLKVSLVVMLILIFIGIGAAAIYVYHEVTQYNLVFANHIYVNDVAIGGLTQEEALIKIKEQLNTYNEEHFITLFNKDKQIHLSLDTFNPTSNLDEVLQDAYTPGHEGHIFKRFLASKNTALESIHYLVQTSYDLSEIEKALEVQAHFFEEAPIDATIERKNRQFYVTPEQIGYALDSQATASIIYDMLTANELPIRPIQIVMKEVTPSVTAKELEKAQTPLASFSTSYNNADQDRNQNLAIAASKINAKLNPGESFSLGSKLEPITPDAGYKASKVIVNGKLEEGIGGGVCQIASTLYNALLLSDIEIISRANHSLPVAYVPLGRDATYASELIDFKFRNNSQYPLFVESYCEDNKIIVNLFGDAALKLPYDEVKFSSELIKTTPPPPTIYKEDDTLYEDQEIQETTPLEGKTVKLYRLMYKNGELVSKELINTSYYKARGEVIKVGTKPRLD